MKKVKYNTQSVFANDFEWTQALPENINRDYIMVQNLGNKAIYLGFNDEQDMSRSILISAGSFFEPFTAPINSIQVLSTEGYVNVLFITEPEQTITNL